MVAKKMMMKAALKRYLPRILIGLVVVCGLGYLGYWVYTNYLA